MFLIFFIIEVPFFTEIPLGSGCLREVERGLGGGIDQNLRVTLRMFKRSQPNRSGPVKITDFDYVATSQGIVLQNCARQGGFPMRQLFIILLILNKHASSEFQ